MSTGGDKTRKRNKPENISQCRHDKGQLVKLLSYHPMTDVLPKEKGKVADNFRRLIFYSIASHVMNWPFFLAFVPIENDDEEEKESIIE